MAAVGERHRPHPFDRVGDAVLGAEKQQDVAGLDADLAHPLAEPPALPGQADQGDTTAAQKPHVLRGSPDRPRPLRHDRLRQHHRAADKAFLLRICADL